MKVDNEREKLKQELLEELKQEYQLIPIKEAPLNVSDILEKYYDDISIQTQCELEFNWSAKQAVANAIRKVVCMHFGYTQLKHIPSDKRNDFRIELERFIKDYILGGK